MKCILRRFRHEVPLAWVAAALIFSCSLPAWAPCGPADTRAQAEALALEGIRVYEESQADGLKKLEQAHARCPDHWAVAYNLGLAAYRSGQADRAYALWKGLTQKGSHLKLFSNLGWLALERGKTREAEQWLEKRKKAGDMDATTMALGLEILFARGKYARALDLSFTQIRFVPFAYRRLAVEYVSADMWNQFRKGEQDQAIERATDLAERFPEVKSLERVRDTMVAALLDDNMVIPETRVLPHMHAGQAAGLKRSGER